VGRDEWALIIAWSASEPERVGEVALLPENRERFVLGRAPECLEAPLLKESLDSGRSQAGALWSLRFHRQRPGASFSHPPAGGSTILLKGDHISRRQLELTQSGGMLSVKNVGRCPLSVNGQHVGAAELQEGDTLHLHDQLLLLCIRRPRELPALRFYPTARLGNFGQPDQDGILGESPAIWKLRDRIAAYAQTMHHILIIGESGTGKELAAQALHRLSERGSRRLIADNAAALPPSLAAALLFGNRRNFPNPGMEERIGLVGSAHGSTLFLDEIGDMPKEVQPMFLRVAERGEYTRLGDEGRVQHADFRLLGATNRPEYLRYELKRRFAREVRVPGLEQRKEDIPLLVRHILLQLAAEQDIEATSYVRNGNVMVSPLLIEKLLHHPYQTHVSELKRLLGMAMAESDGVCLRPFGSTAVGASWADPVRGSRTVPDARPSAMPLPLPAVAQECLDSCQGNIRRAAVQLGISRHQLNRMIQREGLKVSRPEPATNNRT
jgi:two-component system nitrogen regulation response regulator GlnG/two-component system response regulator HydG